MRGDKLKKSYYAIIPANVRYDKELTPNAKLLYGEITALCNEKGFCWASNSYFAKLYEVKKETISRWISLLEQNGYIKTELIYKEGTNEIINRYIQINHEPIDEKVNTPIDEKVKENTTVINNTVNKEYIVEIINYLNIATGKNFRTTTKKTQRLIKARMNEGFVVEDFKKVIDVKTSEWENDNTMSKYLRPETLFGTKFEGYLNEVPDIKQKETKDEPNRIEELKGFVELGIDYWKMTDEEYKYHEYVKELNELEQQL